MRRSVVKFSAAFVVTVLLPLAGCSAGEAISMPDIVGKRLDLALSDVQRAGFTDEVQVTGGGTFGIIDKTNWTVCSQEPASGAAISAVPRVTVDRACGGTPLATLSSNTKKPDATPSADPPTTSDENAVSVPSYGQTEPFTASATAHPGEPVSLDVTVSAPTRFTPDDPTYATQAANVYFTVTIKNTGTREFEANMLGEMAISGLGSDDPRLHHMAGDGTDGDYTPEIVGENSGVDGSPEIQPGKSLQYRIGFSVANANDVTFTMRPYGLGGDTLYWTK